MRSVSTELLLGYRVYNGDLESCLDDIISSMELPERKWLACLNPHSFAEAVKRPNFKSALCAANLLIPDGVGIVLASRILGGGIKHRITGPDVFFGLHERMQESGNYSVFLLGSTDETLGAITQRMSSDWPDVTVTGSYSPPFKAKFSERDIDVMVERINSAKPDVLWVAMTAPKQEEWIHEVWPQLDVRFAAAVGAVFDFYTGKVKRPHPLVRRLGLEWLTRLLGEPRRLWRRTFVSAPVFMWHVAAAKFKSLRFAR